MAPTSTCVSVVLLVALALSATAAADGNLRATKESAVTGAAVDAATVTGVAAENANR